RLHTNGCGDFTLMSTTSWFAVRGYPEFQMFSFHIDGLLCQVAHFAGARERVLGDPMRIYHIEHSVGSGWTPEGHEALLARLRSDGVPRLDFEQYRALPIRTSESRRPIIFNDD